MIKQIPNIITSANLFCGCLAILNIFHQNIPNAAIFIIAALIFDFLDGFLARKLKVISPLGKQLDSLADMVTFGVVPGMLLYQLMLKSNYYAMFESRMMFKFFLYYMFIVPVFSAWRLAKFNNDERQSAWFVGLPTPANTLLILSLAMMVYHNQFGLQRYILNSWSLVCIASLSSWLLIAEIPLVSLKFKNLAWKENKSQYLLLAFAAILLPVGKFAAVPVIILFYIILSLLNPPGKQQVISQ